MCTAEETRILERGSKEYNLAGDIFWTNNGRRRRRRRRRRGRDVYKILVRNKRRIL